MGVGAGPDKYRGVRVRVYQEHAHGHYHWAVRIGSVRRLLPTWAVAVDYAFRGAKFLIEDRAAQAAPTPTKGP